MMHLLSRVFASFDSAGQPFQPDMSARFLLFPTPGYVLSERQFAALTHAAAAADGGSEALCVITEDLDYSAPPDTFETFTFPLSSSAAYKSLEMQAPILQENVLTSRAATWGVLFSREYHAIVGGSQAFGRRFRAAYPEADAELEAFAAAWRRQADTYDISWLPGLLSHLGRTDL